MTMEFKWTWYTHDGEPTEDEQPCDACDADVPVYSFSNSGAQYHGGSPDARMFLCELCGATAAGNAYQYPTQFPYADTLFTSNYGANMILKHLGKFGERPAENPELAK